MCFDLTGNVSSAFHTLTSSEVAIKSQIAWDAPDTPCVLPYEARLCRGELSLKKVVMLGLQMLDRIEFVRSRGVILRDVKPEKFAMGDREKSHIVYLLDFGLAKLYVNPSTGAHIAFREGCVGLGTLREEQNKDGEAILKHWETSCYISCMVVCLGKVSTHQATRPSYFEWFEEKPNYALLRQLFSQIIDREGVRETLAPKDHAEILINFTWCIVNTCRTRGQDIISIEAILEGAVTVTVASS
ncbi:hypothetical protein DFH29DRAFT_877033 [Suillus ampliporus]|nr:hypothetical protein DFH29DRAFT_877033 [Suillus ampliporus]